MKIKISLGMCLKRKTTLVWVKEYIKKNFAACKCLCNLQELYTAFKEKHPNVILGSQSAVPSDPNGVFWLAQKWLTLFAFVALIKIMCCYSMQWTGTWHTKTWSRRLFRTLKAANASRIGVNPVLALQLWKNFLMRNSLNMKMMRNLIIVSGTLWIEQFWKPLQLFMKNTKRLWLMLLMI